MRGFNFDRRLVISSLVIFAIGLLALGGIETKLMINQLVFFGIGVVAFIFFSHFDYANHQYLLKPYAWGGLVLLLLPFLFGVVTRGSIRWIPLGSFTLQPSEIIKPFLIVILAAFMAKLQDRFNEPKTWGYYLLLLLIPFGLIFQQPDLGSALVILSIWLVVLVVSRAPIIFFASLVLLGILGLPLGVSQLADYQKQRLVSFMDPFADPKLSGYQVIQSVIAVGSGGIWGKGLGQGIQSQLKFLPERQTDFIFATIAEELGLAGSLVLVAAYGFLLWRLLAIAQKAPDSFSFFMVIGTFAMLTTQGVVNIGMNLGLMPITGITLPLVSSGGSSLLSTMIALGMVHNISLKQRDQRPLEIR